MNIRYNKPYLVKMFIKQILERVDQNHVPIYDWLFTFQLTEHCAGAQWFREHRDKFATLVA